MDQRILIIDDERQSELVIAPFLKGVHRYIVSVAATLPAARGLLAEDMKAMNADTPIEMILMDVVGADDKLAFVKEIKVTHPKCKVFVYTRCKPTKFLQDDVAASGADGLWSKSLPLDELAGGITKILRPATAV